MNKELIYQESEKHIREDLRDSLRYIIDSVPFEFLENLGVIVLEIQSGLSLHKMFVELDFIVTKGRYFGYLELDKVGEFGLDYSDVPDLISKWRDEKINSLGI